jgi:hypothetical protein
LAVLKNAESRQPASRYAARSARCTARCSAGQKEERSTALFRATVSAGSQTASRYAECSARCPAHCSAVSKEERSTALFRATVSADSQPATTYAECARLGTVSPACYESYVVDAVNTDIPHSVSGHALFSVFSIPPLTRPP